MKGQVMHGQIGSPLQSCKNDVGPNPPSNAQSGGETAGPFGQYKQAPTSIQQVTKVEIPNTPMSNGQLMTPLDGTTNIGSPGSSGTGPVGQGGISTPWTGPFEMK